MVTHNAKVKLQNPGGQTLQPETVHYLVMEAGVYTQPGVYTVTLMVNGVAVTWDNNGNPSTGSGQAC